MKIEMNDPSRRFLDIRLQYSTSTVVLALIVLFCISFLIPASAFSVCTATRKVVVSTDGALVATATYNPSLSTPSLSSFDISITNRYGAWYYIRRIDPSSGTDSCWVGKTEFTNLPTSEWPLDDVIGPWGTIEIYNVHLKTGDKFALCHVGIGNASGLFEAENRAVLAITALDMIGIGLFGESLGKQVATWQPIGGILTIISEFLDAADLDTTSAITEIIKVTSDPDATVPDVAIACYKLAKSTKIVKAAAIEALKRLGVKHSFKFMSDLFRVLDDLALLNNARHMIDYWKNADFAYKTAPWGYTGFEVISVSADDTTSPEGYIFKPLKNQIVGNFVNVSGFAYDDCSGIQYVNLTYSTDDWKTSHFVGQSSSRPYEFFVNLSAIADGTTIKFGWDVYDNAGNHANSPEGNRMVFKDSAAFHRPVDDALFMSDITYPDGAIFSPGESFVKTWRIRNTGTSTWNADYKLYFEKGTNFSSSPSIDLPSVKSGQVTDISVKMTAPATPGLYVSYWRPRNASGSPFGTSLYSLVEVRCQKSACKTCANDDQCGNMSCSAHNLPSDGERFQTPATGTEMFYARDIYKHRFADADCYRALAGPGVSDTQCISNDQAALLTYAPWNICDNGSFIKLSDSSAIFHIEDGKLRPMCGKWDRTSFQNTWGYPFQIAVSIDPDHWLTLTALRPVMYGNGIFPPGQSAPQCGDPGFECGDHSDGEGGLCYPSLHCGPCFNCDAGQCDRTDGAMPIYRKQSDLLADILSTLGFADLSAENFFKTLYQRLTNKTFPTVQNPLGFIEEWLDSFKFVADWDFHDAKSGAQVRIKWAGNTAEQVAAFHAVDAKFGANALVYCGSDSASLFDGLANGEGRIAMRNCPKRLQGARWVETMNGCLTYIVTSNRVKFLSRGACDALKLTGGSVQEDPSIWSLPKLSMTSLSGRWTIDIKRFSEDIDDDYGHFAMPSNELMDKWRNNKDALISKYRNIWVYEFQGKSFTRHIEGLDVVGEFDLIHADQFRIILQIASATGGVSYIEAYPHPRGWWIIDEGEAMPITRALQ